MKKHLMTAVLATTLIISGCSSEQAVEGKEQAVPSETVTVDGNNEETKAETGITEVLAETTELVGLKELIIDTYEIPEDYFAMTKYYYNYVDLNKDGADEVFVVVMGPYTSGSGGSSGMILFQGEDGLHINQQFTLLQTPIIISDTMTNGAKDIILYRSGGGVEGSYVKMTASDGIYTTVNDASPIDTLDGVTGRAIISNDLLADMENNTFLTLE